eukprot:4130190-Pleurochrysis_carterae.AAC.1
MAPELVKGFNGQRKGRVAADLDLEATLVVTELACRFALEVDLVDLGNSFGDGALINSNVGGAQRSPGVVVVNVTQAGARRLLAV